MISGIRAPHSGKRFKGVYKDGNKWSASINIAGKPVYCGMHQTEDEAALAYDKKAREVFGDSVWLNFPDEDQTETVPHHWQEHHQSMTRYIAYRKWGELDDFSQDVYVAGALYGDRPDGDEERLRWAIRRVRGYRMNEKRYEALNIDDNGLVIGSKANICDEPYDDTIEKLRKMCNEDENLWIDYSQECGRDGGMDRPFTSAARINKTKQSLSAKYKRLTSIH